MKKNIVCCAILIFFSFYQILRAMEIEIKPHFGINLDISITDFNSMDNQITSEHFYRIFPNNVGFFSVGFPSYTHFKPTITNANVDISFGFRSIFNRYFFIDFDVDNKLNSEFTDEMSTNFLLSPFLSYYLGSNYFNINTHSLEMDSKYNAKLFLGSYLIKNKFFIFFSYGFSPIKIKYEITEVENLNDINIIHTRTYSDRKIHNLFGGGFGFNLTDNIETIFNIDAIIGEEYTFSNIKYGIIDIRYIDEKVKIDNIYTFKLGINYIF